MNICIVLGPFQPLPPTGMGAVEKVWMELAKSFVSRGNDVVVVGRETTGSQAYITPDGVNVIECKGYHASGIILVDLIKDFLYAVQTVKQIPDSDIVVTNTFWLPVVLSILKKKKGRLVVHVARYPKWQMWLYQGADVIQAISSAVAQAICEQTPSVGSKVRVIGYPVDLEVFRPVQSGYSHNSSIVYVGRIHPEKGLDLLITAFRRVASKIPQASLEIYGPSDAQRGGGGELYLRKLENAARGMNVRFHGPVSDEKVLASVYQRAGCFCYPSIAERGEAFGRAVLEAMACGIPCVVSSLECFRDFVVHDKNARVFNHRAPDASALLADAICHLLADPGYAGKLGKAAFDQATRFSTETVASQYLQMFESAIRDRVNTNSLQE